MLDRKHFTVVLTLIVGVCLCTYEHASAADCQVEIKEPDGLKELSASLKCFADRISRLEGEIARLKIEGAARPSFQPAYNAKKFKTIARGKTGSFDIQLQKCNRAGQTVTCDFLITSIGEDNRFHIDGRSSIFDDRGREYEVSRLTLNGQARNLGEWYDFISDVPVSATLRFDGVDNDSRSISAMRFKQSVSNGGNAKVTFRHIPILSE